MADKDLILQLNPNTTVRGVNTDTSEEVFALDSKGNASFSGKLTSQSVEAKEGKFGKLYADSIEGLEAKIATIAAQQYYYDQATSSKDDPLYDEEASESGILDTINNQQLAISNYLDISSIDTDSIMVNDFLAVFGQATITNLEVTNGLIVQDSLMITQTSIGNLTEKLYLQPSGLAGIDIMAGKFKIDELGNVFIASDIEIAGKTKSKDLEVSQTATISGSLFANLLKPINSDLAVSLSNEGVSLLKQGDSFIDKVASIDASGSATFNHVNTSGDVHVAGKLNIAAANEAASSTAGFGQIIQPKINTNATTGKAVLAAGMNELTINNQQLTINSLVYITPASDTENKVLYVKSKSVSNQPFFTVAIDSPINKDIAFNWWVIN